MVAGVRYLMGVLCALSGPGAALDPLGHHANHGGDVVARHNQLRDIFAVFCHHAHLSVKVEVGHGLGTAPALQMSLFMLIRARTEGPSM